jgi:hypothetical protein
MFRTDNNIQYKVCFRPLGADRGSANRYACRYLQIEAAEVDRMTHSGALTVQMQEKLDQELSALRKF